MSLNDVLKLNDGEEMSKVIVGKALKNNEELIKDEQNEIKFAKKYQILSKNTALFAEMISEESQQNELIKVDLTKIKAEEDKDNEDFDDFDDNDDDILQRRIIPVDDKVYNIDNDIVKCSCKMDTGACYAMPEKSKKKKSFGFDFFGGIKNLFSKKNKIGARENRRDYDLDYCEAQNFRDIDDEDDEIDIKYSKGNEDNFEINSSKPKLDNNSKDDITNLIMTQDAIEGSWDENNETKKLINIVTSNIFDKIKNKIIALNKGANENKIIYTILVIYYLKTKCDSKLNQYILVINKANKFLNKNGINYDNIISSI